jgi:large subunit ribosomal protein L20
MRVTLATPRKQRHKKLIAAVKGYRGTRKHSIRLATQAVLKAGTYAYRDRRNKKRLFRAEWITRINAALTPLDLKYSVFINGLKKSKIDLDRKVLSQLALKEPEVFNQIVAKVKQ